MVLKVTTTNVQQAKAETQKALRNMITDKFVTVGIHQDKGLHPGASISNAQLGALLHFDKWPWLDVGVAQGNDIYLDMLQAGADAGDPIEKTLEQIGVVAVGQAQLYMTDLATPPNAESTIRQKGSSNPLIDTGQLRQSVAYKVTSGKPTEGL